MSKNDRPARRQTAKDIKREETQTRLLEAARRLFSEYGYDNVTVTEIGKAAGVTHGMINVYFGGKPGLLTRIVQENNQPQFAKSLASAEADLPALERINDILLGWARCDGKEPRLLAVMQSYSWTWPRETEEENAEDRARFKALLAGVVQDGQATGEFASKGDPATIATAMFAIFTWGMRRIVFEDITPETCHAAIMEQVRLVLGVD